MLKSRVYDHVKLVLQTDPALLSSDAEYQNYIDTWKLEDLKFAEGDRPSVFTIRQLTVGQRTKIQQINGVLDRATMALRCGLVDVQDFFVMRPDGSTYPIETPKTASYGEWGNIITPEWIDSAHLTSGDILAIGAAVLNISEARAPLS